MKAATTPSRRRHSLSSPCRTCLVSTTLLCSILVPPGHALLQAAVVLPHGDEALDPSLLVDPSLRRVADTIHAAAAQSAQWLCQVQRPDYILLSTPHGVALSHDFAVYLDATASGVAIIGGDDEWHQHRRRAVRLDSLPLAHTMALEMLSHLGTDRRRNLTGIQVSPDASDDSILHWAEVIPLRLMDHAPPLVILSHPLRRYQSSQNMVPELLDLGSAVLEWMEARSERFAVVVSGDLSHTHLPNGPYGYSNASRPYDQAVAMWAENPCGGPNEKALLDMARSLQPQALSCGFTGLVLLHGMLCSASKLTGSAVEHELSNGGWKGQVLVNRNATYYGMMIAQYERVLEGAITTEE